MNTLRVRAQRSFSVAWMLAVREWTAEFRQSRMSAAWPLIHPLAYTVLFVLLRPVILGATEMRMVTFAVFVFIGFGLWQTWFDVLRAQMDALRRHKGLMSRGEVGVPTLMLATTLGGVIHLVPKLCVALLVAWIVLDASPAALLCLTIFGLLVLCNGAAIGSLLQPFATLAPGLAKVIQSISLGIMVTAAVFIVLPAEPPAAMRWLLAANPLGSLLNAARAPLFGDPVLNWSASIGWSIATVAMIALIPLVSQRVLPVVIERMGA